MIKNPNYAAIETVNPGLGNIAGRKLIKARDRLLTRAEDSTIQQIQYGLDFLYMEKCHSEVRAIFATYNPASIQSDLTELQNQAGVIRAECEKSRFKLRKAVVAANDEIWQDNKPADPAYRSYAEKEYDHFLELANCLEIAETAVEVYTLALMTYPQLISSLGLQASDAGERSKQEQVAKRYILDYGLGVIDGEYVLTAIESVVSKLAFYRLYKILPTHETKAQALVILEKARELKKVGKFYEWLAELKGESVGDLMGKLKAKENADKAPAPFRFQSAPVTVEKWERANLEHILYDEILARVEMPKEHAEGTGYMITVIIEETRLETVVAKFGESSK